MPGQKSRSRSLIGGRIDRIDARDKVTGKLEYPSDRKCEGMLWVAVVRSQFAHAQIRHVDTTRANQIPDVEVVLTGADVPGENAFGIARQDQPVLCTDRVRYQGDAIALVAAHTKQAADQGAKAVQVDYEPLEVVASPQRALEPDAPRVHATGNVLHEAHFQKGHLEEGFSKSAVVIERHYNVPTIEHAYLECEAGLSYYDEVGRLTIESCGQYIYRDQTQIARALGLKLSQIRVTSVFSGGAFGGKDEITVQIHLALVTYHTKLPAKMVATREESFFFSTKRHAAHMWYKTGASKSGKLLALEARFVSDTGAYASLGGPVLNLMVEHAAGPYKIPHAKIDAWAVYTNNGVAGAFRGFGCTQACFAIESQMDLMAHALAIDPLSMRQANVLHKGDRTVLDYEMVTEVGALATIKSAKNSRLWKERKRSKNDLSDLPRSLSAYIKRGVGAASQMQGLGLGVGLPDYCEIALTLGRDGRFELAASTSEIGQGAYTTYVQMLADQLGIPVDKIDMLGGDTAHAPDSGTTTASRTTYAVGNAIIQAASKIRIKLGQLATSRFGWPVGEAKIEEDHIVGLGGSIALAELPSSDLPLCVNATFHIPTAELELGDGLPHILYSYGTHVALVEVHLLTGEIKVLQMEAHLDGGKVISLTGFEGQSEGGVAQGVGYALCEEIKFDSSQLLSTNFNTYMLPTSMDVPDQIRTIPVEVLEPTGPYGAKGISETCMVGPTPAIVNAIEHATGLRFTHLPVRAEDIIRAQGVL